MTFDSNEAWKAAVAAVNGNREVLFAIAGVFILLPSLAFAVLVDQPEPEPGMMPRQILAMAGEFYAANWFWMVLVTLLQGIGTLSVLAMLTDRNRPTVSDAIRLGSIGFASYFAANLLIGIAFGVAGGLLFGLAAAAGAPVLAALLLVLIAVAAIYVFVKTSLVAPVIMVEDLRNPVTAIQRSWTLTRGNSVRIFLFYLLLGIAALVVLLVAGGLAGLVAGLAAGAAGARLANAVVSSLLGAVMSLGFVAVLAAVHRQLAGASPEAIGQTFE